ncbi:MAG: hypothetical protein RSC24_08075 [Clostridium sp.]|uniref:hypothetical protein n=1 Tax=Clostridium sp. TaxID=1506 RepID=UPI00303546ED
MLLIKSVSNKFKAAIVAPSRMCKMRVTFDISDITANGDISNVITSTEFSLSDKQQMFNKERESSYKLATWEKSRWKLDGSFVIPSQVPATNGEMGWWSNTLCGEDSMFTTPADIEIIFSNTHSSMGLTITFDTLCNEYAVDFDIIAYSADNNIISTVNITNNTKARFVIETPLYLYKKILIKIKKWCKPYSRAKVLEIDFGVVRVYDDDNLIKANLLEELHLTSANIVPSEFKFVVYNKNREFNILNPTGFYRFLQQRQQVIVEIGADITSGFEYCKMGTYWLKEWTSDEGAMTATFTARNIIDSLDGEEYESLTSSTTNLKAVAIAILSKVGIIDYELDATLERISTTGLIKKVSCRTALQMVAIAAKCNVYVVDNKLYVKLIKINLGVSSGIIDMDNMFKEPQISLEPLIKNVEVKYYTNLGNSVDVICTNAMVKVGDSLKVDNTLISTLNVAQAVGNWIISIKNLRALYTTNWRQNPSFEGLDVVDIENAYETKKVVIVKQEYEYQGDLRGKSTLIGGINIVD